MGRGVGGVLDRGDVLDVMHGRSRMTIDMGRGGWLLRCRLSTISLCTAENIPHYFQVICFYRFALAKSGPPKKGTDYKFGARDLGEILTDRVGRFLCVASECVSRHQSTASFVFCSREKPGPGFGSLFSPYTAFFLFLFSPYTAKEWVASAYVVYQIIDWTVFFLWYDTIPRMPTTLARVWVAICWCRSL